MGNALIGEIMPAFSFTPAPKNGQEVDPRDTLFAACEAGDSDRVYLLLNKESESSLLDEKSPLVDAVINDGTTPLFVASKKGHIDCVKNLLDAKADASLATRSGLSPLWIAAQKGRKGCVELLLNDFGSKMDQSSKDGRTPLYAACESGNVAIVLMLLNRGAKTESRRKDGSTPLIVASYLGHTPVVSALLAAGARLHHRDEDGTALDNARKQNKVECVELLEAALKDQGIDLSELNDQELIAPLEQD